MTTMQRFALPDVGEGLTEAEIVGWTVSVGDTVKVNDTIVEIETAKSVVALPSPFAGRVNALFAEVGALVPVGAAIIEIETAGGSPPTANPTVATGGTDGEPDGAILVGYGPRSRERRRRIAAEPVSKVIADTVTPAITPPTPAAPTHARAKPPLRKLAKQLGVELTAVTPTGANGVITRADLASHVEQVAADGAAPGRFGREQLPPREERIAVRGVRRATAEAMVRSAFTAPHVTEFVTVDFTRMLRLLRELQESREFDGVRLSLLTLIARSLCLALRRNPELNARWDDASGDIIRRNYVNLGIAAATPRGLLVPNIKDADQLSLAELARQLDCVISLAREGRTTPAQMTGGTMSITNIGPFGIDTGTPILPPGESAILVLGAVRKQPWAVGKKIKLRDVGTLGLSFDHRLIDGEQGSRFLADLASLIERPDRALAWA